MSELSVLTGMRLEQGFARRDVEPAAKISATRNFVPGDVIVRWFDDNAPGAELGEESGLTVKRQSGGGLFLYRTGDPNAGREVLMQATRAAVGKLCRDPRVKYAQPNFIHTVD